MTKKVVGIVLAALAVAALIAVAWWWFLNRSPQAPVQQSSTFGSAQNKPPAGSDTTGGQPTNIGSPTTGSGQTAGTAQTGGRLVPGSYVVKTTGEQIVGSYVVSSSPQGGSYTFAPQSGASDLGSGTYVLTSDGVSLGSYNIGQLISNGTSSYTIEGVTSYGTGGTTDLTGTTNPYTAGTTTDLGLGDYQTPGVDWLGTDGGNTINGSAGTVFNPKDINQINNSNPNGGVLPNIGGDISGGSGGNPLGGALAGVAVAGVAGAITCGAQLAFSTGATAAGAAATPPLVGTAAAAALAATIPISTAATAISVSTVSIPNQTGVVAGVAGALGGLGITLGGLTGNQAAQNTTDSFWGCLARTVAKIALNQITNSVVNWINSGFNGAPSFVTNPTQFFANVADNAAGEFIKGSALSFLCSPFQLQIKIAIAQSYANRNANSCTLTGIINNLTNFMNGNFAAGGWPGLLAFTTTPTNNPYGAYAYASIGLTYSVQTAVGEQQRQLSLGNGFLDFTKNQNCKPSSSTSKPTAGPGQAVETYSPGGDVLPSGDSAPTTYAVCDVVHTTPGHVIADALGATQNSTFTELDVAKSFDEIISALITQLVTRTLQSGLSNLSGTNGYESNFYTPDQLNAQSAGSGLLLQMQADVTTAQNYGSIQQGSIQDIQSSQSQLNDLYNCWNGVANGQSGSAKTNADAASSTIQQLDGQVDVYNTAITNVNNSITLLDSLQSRALSAASTDDVTGVQNDYTAAKASGQILSATDVTTAQQNRTTLQSQLGTLNQQTSIGLQLCQNTASVSNTGTTTPI